MPRPTESTTVSRPELGALAYAYMLEQSRAGFAGLAVMPLFEVQEASAEYPKIPLESMLKIPDTRRAADGSYSRGDWNFEMGTYSCVDHGYEQRLDDSVARLYARLFDAEANSIRIATDHIARGHEKRVATFAETPANRVGDTPVTNPWSDASNATPKADVKTGAEAMRQASGLVPNLGVMSETVWQNLTITNEIKSYLQYTSPHLVDSREAQIDVLARYFSLSRLVVAGGIEDTAASGQSASIGDLWSSAFFHLFRVPENPASLEEPSFGRTFLWVEDSPDVLTVEQYRENSIRSEIYRVRNHVAEALVFAGAHYTLSNITA